MSDKDRDVDVQVKERVKTKRPPMYKVMIHNDDYTPMDFVVMVLTNIFAKSESEAVQIMLNVHNQGAGLAGIYPRELAEMKVHNVEEIARQLQHPLRCSMQQE